MGRRGSRSTRRGGRGSRSGRRRRGRGRRRRRTGTVLGGDEGSDSEDGLTDSKAEFELYEDNAGQWRWRLVHNNGNIIADSGEGYDRKAGARNGLESVMANASGADVVEQE
ncbi:hypothetical protein BRC64_12180 [Halobacteriales archaeon QH_10_67_22]|nr:MAG: hypothetical protein BRC64_12180 [Halobacteriales archaeon QH_10_67_22]